MLTEPSKHEGGLRMEIYQLQAPSEMFEQTMNKLMIAYNMEKLGDVGTTAAIQLRSTKPQW